MDPDDILADYEDADAEDDQLMTSHRLRVKKRDDDDDDDDDEDESARLALGRKMKQTIRQGNVHGGKLAR